MPEMKRKSKAELEKSVMAILLDEDTKAGETEHDFHITLGINDLVPYADHPFKLYEGERLDDMVRSVREHGVIVPVIVRPHTDDEYAGMYEILSGHNRVNAAKIAGLTKVPVVIKTGLTDNEARLIVTETNLMQRSFADLSHSERAIALHTHLEALKSSNGGQGKRTDLLDEIKILANPHDSRETGTSDPMGRKLESRDIAAEKYGLSSTNVSRYVRLNNLMKPLLERTDSDEIPFRAAVSLSYLSPDEQDELNHHLSEAAYKVDMKKAESLCELSEGKKLTDEKMIQVLSGALYKKPKPKTAPPLKIKAKIYQKF